MRKEAIASFVLVGMIISMVVGVAAAYDTDNPWTGTVEWTIANDTTFSVTFAGSETQVNFSSSDKTVTNLEPGGQDAGASTPIITVSNDGNVNQDFSCDLSTSKPAYAIIKVSDSNTPSSATEFDTTQITFASSIAAGSSSDMYLWTNLTDASPGTETRQFNIHSGAV